MRIPFLSAVLVSLYAVLLCSCGEGGAPIRGAAAYYEAEDDCGRTVRLDKVPKTLVSLAPSVSDMLVALGEVDMLRGVTKWCDRPEVAAVERIGDMMSPNIERIISLGPDLVMGTEMTPRHVYDTLEGAGIRCMMFKHQGLSDVMADMGTMCRVLGRSAEGDAVLQDMSRRREELLAKVELARKGLKVALLYDTEYLGSAGRGSWVDDMLSDLGLDNIANRAASPWPRLSMEALLTERPDFIILPLPLEEAEHGAFRQRVARLKDDKVWGRVEAVKNDRILLVPANFLNIPGSRTLDAMSLIAAGVYGW